MQQFVARMTETEKG